MRTFETTLIVDGQGAAHLDRPPALQDALVDPNDLLIEAIAVTHQLTLITHNTGEISRVGHSALTDWLV